MTKHMLKIAIIFLLVFAACSPKNQTEKPSADKNDFTLTSIDGEEITLSELKGRVVLIDFWATWCPPCRKSIPVFVKLYNKYNEQGFTVLGISREDKVTLDDFRNKIGIPYPILLDDKGVSKGYGVQAIPTILILDKQGKIRKTQVGFAPELESMFDAFVVSLLNE